MSTPVTIAGTITAADRPSRTITGRLFTYGEEGRTNLGRVAFSRDVPALPDNPGSVLLNVDHDRNRPIGWATSFERTDAGVDATFRVAHTPAGEASLAEAVEGLRAGLSVELAGAVIRQGRLIAGALSHVGVVVAPAFPSSTIRDVLVAADTGDVPPDSTPGGDVPDPPLEPVPDEPTQPDEEVAPDDPNTTGDPDPMAPTPTPTTRPAAAPDDLKASASPPPTGLNRDAPVEDMARLFADAYARQDRTLVAALSNIVYTTTGVDTLPPQFVSELWSGRAYERRYVPLLTQGPPLTSMRIDGWRWTLKPAVAAYAGDKAPVTSNAANTEPVTTNASRLAGAHDHDRAFVDFSVPGYWESYWRAMTESYATLSDNACLAFLVASATAFTPGAVPAGIDAGTAAVIDGALAVLASGGVPSFAVVAADVYRGMMLTTTQNRLALFDQSLGLEGGDVGTFRVVPAAITAGFTSGQIVVGAREAASWHELPGVPIRAEAEHIADGGRDTGLFGYYAPVLHSATTLRKADLVP